MGETTIRDVARRAGVSVASASRAMNGLSTVRQETRDRVVSAAAELGYVPHAAARSLSLSRAHAIGVVLPDLHGEFFSEMVRGMDREANRRGYVLLLSTIHDASARSVQTVRAMHGRVDGLVVMAPHIDPVTLGEMLPRTLPSLLVNSASRPENNAAIAFDNAAGIELVVHHLVARGARRPALIAGPNDNVDARERAEAFDRVCAELLPGPPLIIPGDFSEEAGEHAAKTVLALETPPDALVAANDMMAIGALHVLRTAGCQVPDEIAVAGFDDVPLARYLGLTTVRVRIAELGERAVNRLIDRLEGRPDAGLLERHAPELVVRNTSPPERNT
jgi:LacI family transcriptional regulator